MVDESGCCDGFDRQISFEDLHRYRTQRCSCDEKQRMLPDAPEERRGLAQNQLGSSMMAPSASKNH
jgi:hypothetical protein